MGANEQIANLGLRAGRHERLDRSDILALASASADDPHELLHWAGRLRRRRFGNSVKLCSIAAGKVGACSEDCKWCAQSGSACSGPKPTRTDPEHIASAALEASRNGAASFGVVNSGRQPSRADLDDLATAAGQIRRQGGCDIEICASLGELTPESAERLIAAGVTRYNHNLETSRSHFPHVVSSHSYEDRLRTLRVARQAGLRLCCGAIFGLGETWQDRAELALTLRDDVQPDVVPMNFLHPIPGTALEDSQPLEPMEILRIIAIFRLVLPEVDLKLAGGREANLRDLQSWMFHAGATSCLVGNYLTTPGRSSAEDLQMIADLGLSVVKSFPQTDMP